MQKAKLSKLTENLFFKNFQQLINMKTKIDTDSKLDMEKIPYINFVDMTQKMISY